VDPGDAQVARPPEGAVVEPDGGAESGLTNDFDVAEPGSRPPTGAERLEHGLLGGEQTSDVLQHGVALRSRRDLAGATDALEKALPMARQQTSEALELDQVEADA
jgi:hypothetical protein